MIRNKAESKRFAMSSVQSIDTGSLSLKVEREEDILETPSAQLERSPVQLNSVCRMCAHHLTPISLATPSPSTTLTYQLLHYFGIMLKEDDGMPTGICGECNDKLDYMEGLKQDVAEVQKLLQEQLAKNQESSNTFQTTYNSNGDHIIDTQCTVLKSAESDNSECEIFNDDYPIFPVNSDTSPVPINSDHDSSNQSYDMSTNDHDYIPSNYVKKMCGIADSLEESDPIVKNISKINSQIVDNSNTVSIVKPSQSKVSLCKKYVCKICLKKYNHLETFKIHFEKSHAKFNNYLTNSTINRAANKKSFKKGKAKIDFEEGGSVKNLKTEDEDKKETCRVQLIKEWGAIEYYICKICDHKKYDTSLELFNHYIDVHMKENELECKLCSKTFCLKNDLLRHLKKKSVHVKFFCPICDRTCVNASSLRHHLNVHSTEKNFQCSQCGKRYRTHCTLYSHIKQVHDNVKRFMCESCSQMYHTKTLLVRHILTFHTEVKPFACKICNKGFIRLALLKRHEFIHTQNRPFYCLSCCKGFICKQKWKRHMRITCRVPENDIRNAGAGIH